MSLFIIHLKKDFFRYLIFTFLILFAIHPSYSKILLKPYLQVPSNNGVCVMVESDSKEPVTVQFGSNTSYGKEASSSAFLETGAEPASFVHRIFINGLPPNSVCHYRSIQGSDTTSDSYFKTCGMPGEPLKFAVMGDCRSGKDLHARIAKGILKNEPLFSIYTGDLCFDRSYEKWKSEFFLPEELELSSRVPFCNSPGNHEGWTNNTKAFTQAPQSSSGSQEYYSFDIGDVHFIIISTENKCCKDCPQYKFIEEDLKASKKPWKIAAFHESAYCYGGHGNNNMMKKVSENLFEKYGVQLVVTGHSHFYQHNLVAGIHHLTLAGGGAPLYSPKSSEYTVKSAKEHHYAICDVTSNTLKITVFNIDGKILDEIELKKK
ncbi:MAG: hypothetical protein HW421_17 [Ignavibacteria bacterium]|nr:hypothetical protein [Ignavibacteria bacterium]